MPLVARKTRQILTAGQNASYRQGKTENRFWGKIEGLRRIGEK